MSKSEDSNNINDLAQEARSSILAEELQKLREHNFSLGSKVAVLQEELEQKVSEIEHLKKLLGSSVPVIGEVSPLLLSDVELITTQQINKLKQASMTRELTLDEVKRLDLLVKNQNLARGEATEIPGKQKSVKGKSASQLIQIAKQPIKGNE